MLNVLLVDDEPAARTAFRDLLPEGEGVTACVGRFRMGRKRWNSCGARRWRWW